MPPKSMSPRSVDGFVRADPEAIARVSGAAPAPPQPTRQARPQPAAHSTPPRPQPQSRRHTFTSPVPVAPRRRWWRKLLFPLAILLCLSASFLVQSLPFGMAAITVYAIVAWLRRLPSRYSFVMAFLSLATVIVLLVVRQNVELAGNFATYTFLLLVVGIVSSMLESRAGLKHRRSKISHLRR